MFEEIVRRLLERYPNVVVRIQQHPDFGYAIETDDAAGGGWMMRGQGVSLHEASLDVVRRGWLS